MKNLIFLLALLFISCSDDKNLSQTNPLSTETKFENIYENKKFMIIDTDSNYCLIQNGSGLKAVSLNSFLDTNKNLNIGCWYLEECGNTFKIRNASTGCYMHAEYDSAVTVESVLIGWWSALWNIWINNDEALWFTDRWRQNTIYLSSSDLVFQYTRIPKFIWKLQAVSIENNAPFLEEGTLYKIKNQNNLFLSEDSNTGKAILSNEKSTNNLWYSKKVPNKNGKEVYQFFNSVSKRALSLNGSSIITTIINDTTECDNWVLTDESGNYTIRDDEKNYFIAANSLGILHHIEQRDKWSFIKEN